MGVANFICKLRGHSKINNFVAVGSRKPALLITCHCVPVSIQAGEAGDARVTMLIFFSNRTGAHSIGYLRGFRQRAFYRIFD